jgi:hypothetical protein
VKSIKVRHVIARLEAIYTSCESEKLNFGKKIGSFFKASRKNNESRKTKNNSARVSRRLE